jgi:hypothetical protein
MRMNRTSWITPFDFNAAANDAFQSRRESGNSDAGIA